MIFIFFFFNDTSTTEIYTLSLHDALPISVSSLTAVIPPPRPAFPGSDPCGRRDRKSTRLNSSHANISYAVFCLKKKKQLRAPTIGQKYTPPKPCIKSSHTVEPRHSITLAS